MISKEKLIRGFNHYYTKLQSYFYERQYKAFGTRVKYMFYPQRESDTLLVSFPACAPNTAKYNYMRTVLPFQCNKLFLLDDFGNNHQGCYLVEDNVEKCTVELLSSIIQKCASYRGTAIKNIIFFGSSKGGYSALNFSFLIHGAKVVIGAPQYYLGNYLDKEGTRTNLEYLIGNITEEGKDKLNVRLKERIASSKIHPEHVFFHYSNVEHTYEEHVKDMIFDLKNAGVEISEDIHEYPNHGDLKDFYPPFLIDTIKHIIE